MTKSSAECWQKCRFSVGFIGWRAASMLDVLEVLLFFTNLVLCEKIMQIEIEMIKAWLHKIGEPEADHFLVLDKNAETILKL